MSPFTPFFCDHIWQNLKKVTGNKEESVHFTLLPTPDESLIDHTVERRVEAMRSLIDLVRVLREKAVIPVKVCALAICHPSDIVVSSQRNDCR